MTGGSGTEKTQLEKDIEFQYESFRGTEIAKRCVRGGYFATMAIEFCKYYVKKKEVKDAGEPRQV